MAMYNERLAEYLDGVRAQRCCRCEQVKHLDAFYVDPSKKLGRSSTCKPCVKSQGREWRAANIERNKASKKVWTAANPGSKRRSAWKAYGINFTYADYTRLLVEQGNRCKICGVDGTGLKKALAPDHNHSTGVVRGLLCCNCNQGLGRFHDSVDKLKTAIEYLEASICRER